MTHAPDRHAPPAWPAWHLGLVRTLAWALLFGGWIVLGTLGRQHLAPWAAGQAPVALWLATIGALLALAARRPPTLRQLRATLVAAGLVLAFALATAGRGGGGPALALAAIAWGVLLVAVSLVVRALRLMQAGVPPAPLLPALAGAVLVWLASGDPGRLHDRLDVIALALAVAALTVAALVIARAPAYQPSGCRSGLFDCSLPMPSMAAWHRTGAWPMHAAALAMLPMMAALPVMAEWCGATPGWFADGTVWHLGAMVVPALCLRGWLQRADHQRVNAAVAALLLAGGVALLVWPGLNGLIAAALLHAMAWSLGWAAPMVRREAVAAGASRPARVHGPATLAQAGLTAVAVLALGMAIEVAGLQALVAVHAALAVMALAGVLISAGRRGERPVTTKELPS
jgi:hypothetical protein